MLPPPRHCRALAAALLLAHAALLLCSIRHNFVTIDEAGHVPAGLSHWQTGGFALYRVNPPLPRMLATLPVLLARPDTAYDLPDDLPGRRLEWEAGPPFADANAERYFDLVCLARLAGVAWSLLGGWIVYRWATELYGGWAGCLSLALWCFSPTVLAHAQLVTPDLPATVAGLTATYVFWRYLRGPSWPLAWFAGLLLGLAQLTKCTLLLLYGIWPLLALLSWRAPDRPTRSRQARLGQAALIVALSVVVLNLGYGLQGTGTPLGDFQFVSRLSSGKPREARQIANDEPGNRFRGGWAGRFPAPVPADYLLGIDVQRRDFEGDWPFYLRGQWREGGSWYFYLYALAVKVPLGAWALVLFGAALALLGHPASAGWREEIFLWVPPLAILTFVSSQTGLNYFRYALPLFPFVLVSTGKLAFFFRTGRWRMATLLALLLAGSAGSTLRAFPHTLAYFNELAGGPSNGHAHLVDSNLDWGQDLLALKSWLDEHPEARPLGLAYFNHVDPRVLGISFSLPPLGPVRGAVDDRTQEQLGPHPGYYAVSVHFVQRGAFTAPDGKGDWRVVPLGGYDYFQAFTPVARAGLTLWVYRITLEEANAVRMRMGLAPLLQTRKP